MPENILTEPLETVPSPVPIARLPLLDPIPVPKRIAPEVVPEDPPEFKRMDPPVLAKLLPATIATDPEGPGDLPVVTATPPDACAAPVPIVKEPEFPALVPVATDTTPDSSEAEAEATLTAPL